MFRALVSDGRGRTILVRSRSDAELLASVLNAQPVALEDRGSPLAPRIVRYAAAPARRGATMIVSDDRGRDKGRARPGIVGLTSDRELAQHVASRLNNVDPAHLKPSPKGVGIGWW
jgi:hypothetical protein